jgi:uncharacterized membrane protein YfhO
MKQQIGDLRHTRRSRVMHGNSAGNVKKINNDKGIKRLWRNYYVYIVSSLLIVIAFVAVLAVKKFWPFGTGVLLNGDFALQGWPFVMELKHKLQSGESLLYTWNVGYGTNFYSLFTYGLFNPSTFIFMLVPEKFFFQTSTILLLINMILMNVSMIYFLTHRPKLCMKNNLPVMLFSLSYTLCTYVVSNINNWTFLIVAAIFPLIILGLERYVWNQEWKLYFFSLTISIFFNYYFTGLFCVFIILYYLTLEFNSFKEFLKKSLRITWISLLSWLAAGVFMIPTAFQMLNQRYTTSDMIDGMWFTTVWDIIKNFFVLNQAIGRGSESNSYGEVNLYYGILLLFLSSLYFLNRKVKISTRIRKLAVVLIYFLAFNMNSINYLMHLGHYPSYFPNRFSLFFTLLVIILASEAWMNYEKEAYANISIGGVIGVAVCWTILVVLCFALSEETGYEFIYYYSIGLFLFYMIAILLMTLFKRKWPVILALLGCIELMLNFDYQMIYRSSGQAVSEVSQTAVDEAAIIDSYGTEEANGFSRTLMANDIISGVNGGMLHNRKTTSIFASSMSNIGYYLNYVGVQSGTNNIKPYKYSSVIMSLLNVQYIFWDSNCADNRSPKTLYSNLSNLYTQYDEIVNKEGIYMYENPTVLSLGYMIPSDSQYYFEPFAQENYYNIYCPDVVNAWVESISGVENVMKEVDVDIEGIASLNMEAMVADNQFYATMKLEQADIDQISKDAEYVYVCRDEDTFEDSETDEDTKAIRLQCVANETGDYYVQMGAYYAAVGYLTEGEQFYLYYEDDSNIMDAESGLSGVIRFYMVDEEQWEKAYDILSSEQLQVTEYSSNAVSGVVEVEEDGILFTSIPYDTNWTLYVDGVETDILPLWDSNFVAVNLSKGTHTIQLKYRQRGFLVGIFVTVFVCLGVTIYCVLEHRRKVTCEFDDTHV